MVLNLKRRKEFDLNSWTEWFAWYPVRLDDNRVVWLQKIKRKDSQPLHDNIIWEYRL